MTAIDVLRDAHKALRKAVPSFRRKAHADEGVLAQTFREAMAGWDRQKAEGVPLTQRIEFLTRSLKAAWPQTREWKYLCAACDDYGLEMHMCPGDATCGRSKAHLAHEYGTPCWCSAGNRFREKPKPSRDDYAQAGKSKPTKVGR